MVSRLFEKIWKINHYSYKKNIHYFWYVKPLFSIYHNNLASRLFYILSESKMPTHIPILYFTIKQQQVYISLLSLISELKLTLFSFRISNNCELNKLTNLTTYDHSYITVRIYIIQWIET